MERICRWIKAAIDRRWLRLKPREEFIIGLLKHEPTSFEIGFQIEGGHRSSLRETSASSAVTDKVSTMAKPDPYLSTIPPLAGTNPYLMENFRPVTEETERSGPFEIEGAIPPGLDGILFRNGPNPSVVADPASYHWFSGDGMLHRIVLRDGEVLSYKNRYVRTRALAETNGTKPPRGPKEAINGPANTNIVRYAGRMLALVESGLPHRMTIDLDTVCVEDFEGLLASPMTAHPKFDPATGRMTAFGYDPFGPPFLRYHEFDELGNLLTTTSIDLPRCVMLHDFAVSATKVAFFDLPVAFDLELALNGNRLPFAFDDQLQARVGVLGRGEPGTRIRWYEIEPCYVFHVANAFDDGDDMIADVVVYNRTFDLGFGGLLGSDLPRLERWTFPADGKKVIRTPIDDRALEFPVIDRQAAGSPYNHTYGALFGRRDGLDRFPGYVKYNVNTGDSARIELPDHLQGNEPLFVRAADGKADDEGWLVCVEYDRGRDASDLVIYDAHSMSTKPEARVHLPVRVPFGFHGTFVTREQLS